MDLGDISALLRARPAGHSLPRAFYTGSAAFEFDLAAIFGTSWLFAGFEAELRNPGNYISFMVGRWPVIIVHGRDGEIRAFHNSCRHRGSILCKPGQGSAARLVCPYHSWTYGLDGRLLAASRMPDDFQKSEHSLKPVHLERIAGAIFICLAETPPDISVMRRDLTPLLAPHNLHHAKLAHQSTLVEYANWKLVMENGRECYHCAAGHPELARTFPINASAYFDFPDDTATRFEARMAALGMPTGPAGEDWWQAVRFPLNDGTVAMTTDGTFNAGPAPETVRARPAFAGTTVNALAVSGGPVPDWRDVTDPATALAVYLTYRVIHGPGAFVERAEGYGDFARAMTRKLQRELQGVMLGALDDPARL